ncbi:MAG: hypothetical protein LBF61_01525 [Azoarcus sp.]|nr:hypothetical protein [Azoarcus sp.]
MRNLEKTAGVKSVQSNGQVLSRLKELYLEAFAHDGFAEIRVEIRVLRRGQKEVILHCGKQYRFVVDYLPTSGDRQRHTVGLAPADEETGWRRGVAAQTSGEEPDRS